MGKAFQQPGMGINNYLATRKDLATQCEYTVSCNSCNAATDYSEEVISDQLVRGIADEDILADLIGEEKTDRTLLEMVEFIARKEQAKLERDQISVENAAASVVKQDTPTGSRTKCKNCRGEYHGADTMHTRKTKSPSWDHKCNKSQVRGHYERACYKCSDCGQWGHKSKLDQTCFQEIPYSTLPYPTFLLFSPNFESQHRIKCIL